MKLKALWYCTKNKPYLIHMPKDQEEFEKGIEFSLSSGEEFKQACIDIKNHGLNLNGKIVAESDFEVEEITYVDNVFKENYHTKTLDFNELIKRSRLTIDDLVKYLGMGDFIEKIGYAIHIKNLNIFDEPKRLYDYLKSYSVTFDRFGHLRCEGLKRAPQNMCYAVDEQGNRYVIISVRPEWLCLILNGLKDVELRRKVLKEMML